MEFYGKAAKAKEEHKIAQYKEELNLIIAEEVAERKTEVKTELMIQSLDTKITTQKEEWVKNTDQYDEYGVPKKNTKESKYLIVETKEGYEFTIEVDNEKETAHITSQNRTSGERYTITYHPNKGTGTPKTVEVKKGFSTILEENDSFTKEYYKFAGWYEKEELEGGAVAKLPGNPYQSDNDITLYAIWAYDAVEITFDANGGTNEMPKATVTKGGTAKLPQNQFEKLGYQFVEWNTQADGKGDSYAISSDITLGNENITLYAIWEIAPAKVGEKVIISKKDNYTDKDGETATVPAGFAIVPGCSDISEGMVISDVANDTENKGNQFVWVPVDNINNFVRTAGYSNGSQQSITNYTEPFANGYRTETSTEASEYNAMKNSVQINHGFYIGRFETGKDSSGNLIVKKGADVYNNVPWGNAMNDIEGTTNTNGKVGAVKLAKEFATNNNYQGVTSTLCYGVQWDAALKFVDPGYTGFAKDSRQQGWYKDNYNNTEKGNTGTNPNHITGQDLIYSEKPTEIANKQKNIYDMAGNVAEWTMEAYDTNSRTFRAGSCNATDGSVFPVSYRNGYNPSFSAGNGGFRLALYL